jgi:hypothetical protein
MSEFKYACPVCGQHMMCDESQAGTVMDCPTCFQKIIAPQAPGPDSKFILTGSKLSDRKSATSQMNAPAALETKKAFPIGLVLGLVVAGAAMAALITFRGKLFHSPGPIGSTNQVSTVANGSNPTPPKPEKPAVVAPPANDANWTFDLGTNPIPDSAVAGRIHGEDFIVERASLSTNGLLTLRANGRGQFEFGATINFAGAPPESLAGRTINVMTNADKAARISFRWKDASGSVKKASYDNGYAMRLEFGPLANNRLPGKIYLCTPDAEKSYLLGSFNADARKPRPKVPKP